MNRIIAFFFNFFCFICFYLFSIIYENEPNKRTYYVSDSNNFECYKMKIFKFKKSKFRRKKNMESLHVAKFGSFSYDRDEISTVDFILFEN